MIGRAEAGELVGSGLLLFAVVGSGVVVDRLEAAPAAGLFFHAVCVGVGLGVVIALFASTSGAHFNPAVTLAAWRRRSLPASTAATYVLAQILGAAFGATLALISFADQPTLAQADETTFGPVLAELIGTTVLVLLILGAIDQQRTSLIPLLVGGWVTAMVFSSSSTGLLNPAVTLVRGFTDTYTGVPLGAVPLFVGAQLLGALLAVALSTRLLSPLAPKGN